ncbi:MMPL family transporter [Tomitella gaofuii]|uniref:MMPL family transporter n=1 Tax=Tomitella gaofuii TaxID=2760083 RepID=UPI0015FA5192|nr:MMPL family transporter [Tomitella gaofuii]
MFAVIARKVIDHPRTTIALWLIAAILVIVFAPSLGSYTTGNQQQFLPTSFESVAAQNAGDEYFPAQSGATGSLVVSRADGAPMTPDDQAQATGLAATLQNEHIAGVVSVQATAQSVSHDGKVAALQVAFAGQPGDDAVNSAVAALRTAAQGAVHGTALTTGLTGNAAIQVDTSAAFDHADDIITIATVVVIVVLLGLIFRSVIVAVLPIIVIGIVLEVVTGVTAWAADLFDFEVSTSLQAILVVVLFGIGTDYVVFLLFRYRERLRAGMPPREALLFSTGVVGKVIASSALTVIGAFAALLLAKLGSLSTLAPGLIIAVAVMLVTALTLVPAVFALLGPRLFWPAGPGPLRAPGERSRGPFGTVGRAVAHRPGVFAAGIVVVLAVLGGFASGFDSTYDTLAELPSDTPAQQAYNTMSASFPPGALGPTQVYAVGDGPLGADGLSSLTAALAAVPGVASVAPPAMSSDGSAALVTVVLADDPYSNDALDLVEGPLRTAAHTSMPSAEVYVGGQTSQFADVRDQLRSDTRLVLPVAAGIIVVILAALLTAVLAPLNLILCVALTFAATLGTVVLVFMHGVGYSGIDFTIPMVLYLFVVAIGTDYNILLASRLHEEYRGGHSPREAVRIAINHDAPTVVAAGLILACTFASLMLTGIANLVELGCGVAVGIVIAAFGMAPLLVPALSALEGRAFWWPTRVHPREHGASQPGPGPGPEDPAAPEGPVAPVGPSEAGP